LKKVYILVHVTESFGFVIIATKENDVSVDDKKAKKVKRLVDCHVEADLSGMVRWSHYKTTEDLAEALERECNDLVWFLRDHRSQDNIALHVIRDFEEVCDACGYEWETMTENEDGTGRLICAGCGRIVDE
jgi:hypothetical protein